MRTSEDVSLRGCGVFADAVQRQVDHVLASKFFSSSPRQQLLLRTIVTESLAGRGQGLKEIVLARDVFGRHDYDPRRHTLVRVEVNAVRRKLAEYYAEAGPDDHVRIETPPGHYVAVFSPLREKADAHPDRTRCYGVVDFRVSARVRARGGPIRARKTEQYGL